MVVLCACSKVPESDTMATYEGPLFVEYDLVSEFRDSSRLKLRVKAGEHRVHADENQEFLNGLYTQFYNKFEILTSTLKADYGKLTAVDQIWFFRGNVVLDNVISNETLMSEELYWDTRNEKIYTDKFVKIKTAKYVLTGVGLEANQDFSEYKILKPKGKIFIENEVD